MAIRHGSNSDGEAEQDDAAADAKDTGVEEDRADAVSYAIGCDAEENPADDGDAKAANGDENPNGTRHGDDSTPLRRGRRGHAVPSWGRGAGITPSRR